MKTKIEQAKRKPSRKITCKSSTVKEKRKLARHTITIVIDEFYVFTAGCFSDCLAFQFVCVSLFRDWEQFNYFPET